MAASDFEVDQDVVASWPHYTKKRRLPNFHFDLLTLYHYHGEWWISLFSLETDDYEGALLHIECDQGVWKFDLFYLRTFWLRWRYS